MSYRAGAARTIWIWVFKAVWNLSVCLTGTYLQVSQTHFLQLWPDLIETSAKVTRMYIWQELRKNIKGPLWFLTLVYKIARLKFYRWIYAVHRFAWKINFKHQKSETLSKELMYREERLTGGFFRTGLAQSGWSCKQKEKYDDDDDNCVRMQSHCEGAEKMWITGNREMGRCAAQFPPWLSEKSSSARLSLNFISASSKRVVCSDLDIISVCSGHSYSKKWTGTMLHCWKAQKCRIPL